MVRSLKDRLSLFDTRAREPEDQQAPHVEVIDSHGLEVGERQAPGIAKLADVDRLEQPRQRPESHLTQPVPHRRVVSFRVELASVVAGSIERVGGQACRVIYSP